MERYDGLERVPAGFGPSAVTIGKFDGVHSGHRAVLAQLVAVAREAELSSVVVTFDRNPLSLINPDACPEALVSVDQKVELLAATGVDATVVLEFTHDLSALEPEDFVRSVLVDALGAKTVLVGEDFRFGARGAGTVDVLRELGARYGFEVALIADVTAADGARASSTLVRELLGEGRVREAVDVLGRLPSIRAEVVHGLQRGRTLGYPTANLAPAAEIEGYIPRDGVYAAWLKVGDTRYPSAVSIGNNPTFDGIPDKTVEAHAFDQNLDLYGSVVEVEFVEYIRPMRKFDGAESLAVQMRADEVQIRELFANL